MKTRIKLPHLIFSMAAGAGLLLLSACGATEGEAGGTASNSEQVTTSSAAFLLAEVPASPDSLLKGLEGAAAGETLTVTGRVAGVMDPVSADFALFVLADESLTFCDEMGNDHCATPWDACCEDLETVKAARTVVQFVDTAGNPVPVNLTGAIGLAANDQVVVSGRLAPDDGSGGRTILADGIAILR